MPLNIPKPTRFVQAGYKPVEGGFEKKEEEEQETARERAARHRQARRAELTYTTSDEQRWARNRARVLSERKKIEVPSFDLDDALKNPELDGVKSVNIDPVSMAMETVIDLIDEGKNFIANPSLGGVAAIAVTAIPGKYADKVLDELPVKKIFSSYEFKAPSGISQKVYQQDIDWDLNVNTRSGVKTNLELVQNGRSPFVIKDGKYSQINLHHSKQNSRGALFELSAKTHQKYYGSNSLHPYLPSKHPINPVDRDIFNVDRDAYWIERGNNEIKKR
ncbi:HNH/ENDO VII family nuclease [Aliivibrio sp. S3MY1]|uniref:HNH/ENDO VII family nuclease n=1 Tax=unclassified Aliivibrio TaxID=2645654 RepID=UPI002379BD37|nr:MULTISPECIES: HNH/ENDO VII family nuclease [unclassified Aliivibrio]MDD9197452.1 HNH/ENDO VII family nuclease [Aliivibrio sp. S3MY1]MDD9200701.1 HNH/ENDO VII family nuclease [Aliivibrio sp. S2MY1]